MNLDFLFTTIYLLFLLLFCTFFRYLPLPNIFGLLAGLKHILCRIRSARCWLLLCLGRCSNINSSNEKVLD
uniref:Uncharacterized protein n=1 Tax=Zosterops lateralis melanops TaxID=1220523 RepID=A0A8D2NSW2_ZOSLA